MQRAAEMGKRRKAERGRQRRALCPPFLFPLAVFLGSVLAGCAGENRIPNDPLVGDDPPPRPGSPAGVAASSLPPNGAPVPPLPAASSAGSLASLAENK